MPATRSRTAALRVGVAGLALAAVLPTGSATAESPAAPRAHPAPTTPAKVGDGCVVTTAMVDSYPPPADLTLVKMRRSIWGRHRWYRQIDDGVPVVGGWWGWHRNEVDWSITIDDCRVRVGPLNTTTPTVRARVAARAATTSGVAGPVLASKVMALPSADATRLVWAVTTADETGARMSYVDAVDARVLKTTVISHSDGSPTFTVGTARVFDPNPVVKLQDQSLSDHDDASTAVPADAYTDATLPRLWRDGRTLVGSWARITNTDRASSPTATYVYGRHSDYFEQVMAYDAITSAQSYVQYLGYESWKWLDGTRGLNAEPQKIAVNAFPSDGSYYIPGIDQIEMGAGGVDDAEDAEAIWHEYGHAIQDDQVPDWGLRYQGKAIGEGFGDYLAVTMSQADPVDTVDTDITPAACVMDWNATSLMDAEPHCVRRTDTDKIWSGTPDGDPHADGEIWSAALWDINQQLGRDEATSIILEAQYWMTPKIGFQKAAATAIETAVQFFSSEDAAVVEEAFASRGLFTG